MCIRDRYTSIQIAGFRATCQYLLWFYLVTRLIRNDRDCMTLYLTLVSLSFVLSLHGIYQYITKAPMPSNWVAQAETAVRTRVYSIFGSPNIMGDFMAVSYTHLRAHETGRNLVCRLLLEKKKKKKKKRKKTRTAKNRTSMKEIKNQ